MPLKPIAILIHVDDVQAGLSWYKLAFENSIEKKVDDFVYLDINGFAIELVPAD